MMDRQRAVRISKLLSLALRHEPSVLGLELDGAGWVGIDEVLRGLAACGEALAAAELQALVAASDKQRFAISVDGARIRASQGHSVDVDLGLEPCEPPRVLFHGTSQQALASIRRDGLLRGARTHVHLSADENTAHVVARRRKGEVVIVTVRAQALHQSGQALYRSDNGIWLTTQVPPEFLEPD